MDEPLYVELFGKDLAALKEDFEAHPEKYRPEMREVLDGSLTNKYLRETMLSEAVFDFYRPVPPPPKEENPLPEKREEGLDDDVEYLDEEVDDIESLDAFWWLQSTTTSK